MEYLEIECQVQASIEVMPLSSFIYLTNQMDT